MWFDKGFGGVVDAFRESLTALSLLPELCADVAPGFRWPSGINDVNFKADPALRAPLLSALGIFGLDGWIHPIESSLHEMEVCVIDPAESLRIVEHDLVMDGKVAARLGTASTLFWTASVRDLARWAAHRAELMQCGGFWSPIDDLRPAASASNATTKAAGR